MAGEFGARELAGVGDGLAEFGLEGTNLRTASPFRERLERLEVVGLGMQVRRRDLDKRGERPVVVPLPRDSRKA